MAPDIKSCVLVSVLAVAAAGCPSSTWAQQTADGAHVQRSLRFAAGAERSLEIDNVWGSIDVTAHDGNTVEVDATRDVRARTADARQAADRDVHLLVSDNVAALRLYVDGPFRRREEGGRRDEDRDPGYEVHYDFRVRVPRDVVLRLRTVNDGEIRVRNTSGRFDVRNVNGRIVLLDIDGAGHARTVNGSLDATFRRNPTEPVGLATVNGDITARFADGLGANVWFKTLNGEIWTDYEYSKLQGAPAPAERRGTTRVWHTGKSGVRIGGGGPSLELETLNGDIKLLRSRS